MSNSSTDGIRVTTCFQCTASAPIITNSTLLANAGYGINVTAGDSATISACTFTNNGNYAIGSEANTTLLNLSGLTATGNGSGTKNAIGYRGGAITGSERWLNGSLPVEATSTATVNSGATLTIDAGATIKFAVGLWLNVYGTLNATGTAASPILFTSNAVTPTPGSWNGIHFSSASSTSQIAYATVKYAGSNSSAAVLLDTSSPTLDHLTVSNSSSEGIRVQTCYLCASSSPTISFGTLTSNAGYGINVTGENSPTIRDCTFTNNGNYAIGAEANTTLLNLSNLTATGNGTGGTKNAIGYRGGTITGSDRWVNGSLLREINGGTTVNAGATLTIDAGATIKFAANQSLNVSGTLTAVGTQTNQIVFTSTADLPAPGGWNNLHFWSASSTSQMAYATINYAGANNVAALIIDSSSPTIDHVTVSNSSSEGIRVGTTGSAPAITNCTLSANAGYGINVAGGNGATITGCTFTNNGNYAIGAEPNTNLLGLTNLTATGNGAGGVQNAIGYRGGGISTTERWLNGSLPREIIGFVQLNTNVTLTIDPGATIKFASVSLDVYGTLTALGTAANPILFTSNSATPVAGSWKTIHYFTGSSASQMSYATVIYSGAWWAGLLIDNDAAPSFDHVTVSTSGGGVRVLATGHPTLRHCSFINTTTGIINDADPMIKAASEAVVRNWPSNCRA